MRKYSVVVFSVAGFILSLFISISFAFKLPDTGQTKCYTTNYPYTEISCSGTGQDGAYTMNPLSYSDNGNGTVSDNNTGLMWQKGENSSTMLWSSSVSYCDGLALGGFSDWRLPSEKELGSLIDYSISNPGPMIRTAYFPNAKKSYYWSATSFAGDANKAWNILFSDGTENYYIKDSYYNLRCVRGAASDTSDLRANGDGTVTDRNMGLTWQQEAAGPAAWSSAISYCESLVLGGAADWRLPNIKELASLTDYQMFYPTTNSTYWSSTSYSPHPDNAWGLYFSDGRIAYYNKGNLGFFVRCVRGQSLSSDLSVSTAASSDPIQAGQSLTYTVRIANSGPDTAAGVVLTDDIPKGTVFVSASSSQGSCSHSSGTVTCDIGTMNNAAAVTVVIVINAPATTGTITNSAIVTSASIDPAGANSTATTNTTVVSSSIQLNSAAYSVIEGSGLLTVNVTRTGAAIGAASARYATANGTAAAGSDYSAAAGIVSWAAGDVSDKIITVPILSDSLGEPSEIFTVTLSRPAGDAALGTPVSATVTILDDDPVVTVTASVPTAAEAGPTAGQFTVTRTGVTTYPLTVFFAVSGTASAGSDYTAFGASVTIPASESSAVIAVTPIDDVLVEADETIVLTLNADAAYAIGSSGSAVVTIISDDSHGTIRLSASAYTANESGGTVLVTAMRTGGSIGVVGVSYATTNGTATAGSDYTSASGALSWPDGDMSDKTITIPIADDLLGEASETFTVVLSNPTGGAALGSTNAATVTIFDNEPVVSITASTSTATEAGLTAGQFTVSRTGAVSSALTVDYTVSGTAASGSDYIAIGTSVTIPIGASYATIAITPLDDGQYEANETVIATLASNPSYTVGTLNSATVAIVSNDLLPVSYYDHFNSVSYTDRWTLMQSGTATVTVSKSLLNVSITKPAAACSYANLMSIPTFDGQNLVIETGVAFKGGGAMYLRLRRDDENYMQFGLDLENLPSIEFASSVAGAYNEQIINAAGSYYLKKKSYKNKTFTLIKTGDDFEIYLNDQRIGQTITAPAIGDAGLTIELMNNSCSTDIKGPKTSFDYVFIKEPLTDGTPSANITLMAPNGGQSIRVGSLYLIEWTAQAEAVRFTIEYSTNAGAKWKVLDTGLQGSAYVWKLSKEKPMATYLLRVTGYNAAGIAVGSDVSDAVFSIVP